MAAAAITLQASGWAYFALGGSVEPQQLAILPKPLVGAIALYFLVNTGLVAGSDCVVDPSIHVADLARQLSVERPELHGRRRRRSSGGRCRGA